MAAVILLTAGLGTWAWAGHQPATTLPPPPAGFGAVSRANAPALAMQPDGTQLAVADGVDVIARDAVKADGPQLTRVALVHTPEGLSLALEMTAEPQRADLRVLSARALDIEIGPVVGPIRTEELTPPWGVSFVKQVSIRRAAVATGAAFVRAHVTLHGPVRSNVRVVDRVVYVDFAAAAPPQPLVASAEIR